MDENQTTTRTRFLKQLGATLAAAVGAGIFVSAASAVVGQCCKDCAHCGGCGGNNCYCQCDCTGIPPGSYCMTNPTGCLASGCIRCPC